MILCMIHIYDIFNFLNFYLFKLSENIRKKRLLKNLILKLKNEEEVRSIVFFFIVLCRVE